jgi:CubicO group peptidase (beta-lactamase class C family)
MSFARRLAAPLLAALAVLLPAGAGAGELPDSLVQRWLRLMREGHVPGMAMAVVRDSGIVSLVTLGQRDIERHLPVTPDTRFYVASSTKPFTATAASLLATRGLLDLDAPVRRILPDFRLADPGLTDSITTRDLLGHRFGLVSRSITLGEAFTGTMTEPRFYRMLARVHPRRRFAYSNLHYTLAGRVIARITNRSWKRLLEDSLFAPAGMTRATCSATRFANDPNAARGYAFQGGRFVRSEPEKVDATMHAAGGIVASVLDLARWLRLELGEGVLDGRRVLPATALRATCRPVAWDATDRHPLFTQQRRAAWAAGWEVRLWRADTLYAHNGQFAGASSFLGWMPGRDLGVVVVTNGSGPAVMLAELIAGDAIAAALGDTAADPLATYERMAARAAIGEVAAVDVPAGRRTRPLPAYAGRFENDDFGVLEVTTRRKTLEGALGQLPIRFPMTGDDRFGGETPGAFELGPRGIVRAVWLQLAADSVRFARR